MSKPKLKDYPISQEMCKCSQDRHRSSVSIGVCGNKVARKWCLQLDALKVACQVRLTVKVEKVARLGRTRLGGPGLRGWPNAGRRGSGRGGQQAQGLQRGPRKGLCHVP